MTHVPESATDTTARIMAALDRIEAKLLAPHRFTLTDGTQIGVGEMWTEVGGVCGRPRADQGATARDLGYGDDVAAMCRDHDPLHAILCCALGVTSQSLRYAAGLPYDAVMHRVEEGAVCALQRMMRCNNLTAFDVAKRLGVTHD